MREASTIEITEGDKVLQFKITPMSAAKAEAFIYRALLVSGGSLSALNGKFDEGKLLSSIIASADYERVKPLLDELLAGTVHRITESGEEVPVTAKNVDTQVELPTTIMSLRASVLKATFGFFGNGGFKSFLTSLRGVLSSIG